MNPNTIWVSLNNFYTEQKTPKTKKIIKIKHRSVKKAKNKSIKSLDVRCGG